ncbi:MAG TPA: hypothetical protein VMG62_02565, partial [Solirubrobacteraceae bacterium]|nr:hypothetical protein [Solirubrobacteraceae bacterium]
TAFAGLCCTIPLIVYYLSHGESLSLQAVTQDRLAITGLTLMIIGFSLFAATLVLHAAVIATRRSPRGQLPNA